jgi:hypothetical protein
MITLNTIIYEGNYNDFLKESNWFFNFESKYISKKTITVNNLNSIDNFQNRINDLNKKFIFDVIYVNDSLNEVKNFFNLNVESTDLGYYYTIPYFTSIYNTTTEYFLNIASDCMGDIKISDEFFEKSFIELTENNSCCTTMVSWCKDNEITKDYNSPHFGITIGEYEELESIKKLNCEIKKSENFTFRYNFTDQFFLGKTKNLKLIDYNVDENISGSWYPGPQYGGNCFEKRMVGHNIINNVYNYVCKNTDYYIHNSKI